MYSIIRSDFSININKVICFQIINIQSFNDHQNDDDRINDKLEYSCFHLLINLIIKIYV